MKESWLKWKEKWSQLSLREKQAVVIGTALMVIFIIYQWIWTPYLYHVNAMRQKITTDQKTLVWMQGVDKTISKIEGQAKRKTKPVSPVELLSLLQKQVNQANLSQSLTQLKQATNESITLHFQKVEFDKLIHFLTIALKEQPIIILQMSAIAENAPGIVNADIVLK